MELGTAELFRRFGGVFCALVFGEAGRLPSTGPRSLFRRGLFAEGEAGRLFATGPRSLFRRCMLEGERGRLILAGEEAILLLLLLGLTLFFTPLGDIDRRLNTEEDEEEASPGGGLPKEVLVSAGDDDLRLLLAVVGVIDFSDSCVVRVDLLDCLSGTVIIDFG